MTRRRRRFALWGWRRGQAGYAIVPGVRAAREDLEVIAAASHSRDYVTVATR